MHVLDKQYSELVNVRGFHLLWYVRVRAAKVALHCMFYYGYTVLSLGTILTLSPTTIQRLLLWITSSAFAVPSREHFALAKCSPVDASS